MKVTVIDITVNEDLDESAEISEYKPVELEVHSLEDFVSLFVTDETVVLRDADGSLTLERRKPPTDESEEDEYDDDEQQPEDLENSGDTEDEYGT